MSFRGPCGRLIHAGIWAAIVCVLAAGCRQKAERNADRESALAVAKAFLDALQNREEDAYLVLLSEGNRAGFRQQRFHGHVIRRYTISSDEDGAAAEGASQYRFVGSLSCEENEKPYTMPYTILLGKEQQSGRWLVESFSYRLE